LEFFVLLEMREILDNQKTSHAHVTIIVPSLTSTHKFIQILTLNSKKVDIWDVRKTLELSVYIAQIAAEADTYPPIRRE
jgi:hypothetical protein